MSKYKVLTDMNSGANPVGSIIELEPEEAAGIPWAVELIEGQEAAGEKPKLPSVKEVVAQVIDIEDDNDRLVAADDLLKAEIEREDPPTRTTLVSHLEEIIAHAQEGESE